jgi:hypothetical protein
MTLFQTIAAILCTAALANYLDHRYLRLPATMGLMVISLLVSLGFVLLGKAGVIDIPPAIIRAALLLCCCADFRRDIYNGFHARRRPRAAGDNCPAMPDYVNASDKS